MVINNARGIGIISAIFIILIVSLLGITAVSMLGTNTAGALNYLHSQQALFTAESGIQYVAYKIANDPAYRGSPTTVTRDFGKGSFSVSVSKNADEYTLTSTGSVESSARVISILAQYLVSGYPGGVPDAFNYASYVGQNISLSNSTNGTINGNIAAGQNVSGEGSWAINGTISEMTSIDFPSVDYAAYQGAADYVKTGNFTFQSGSTYSGIYYVTGNATVENNVTINGGIVCEGTINMRAANGITINPESGLPALVSSGTINMSNASGVNVSGEGLIYTEQGLNLQRASNVTIFGTIAVGQGLSVNNTNNVTITFNPDILINPPPFFEGYTPGVSLSAWDEVY